MVVHAVGDRREAVEAVECHLTFRACVSLERRQVRRCRWACCGPNDRLPSLLWRRSDNRMSPWLNVHVRGRRCGRGRSRYRIRRSPRVMSCAFVIPGSWWIPCYCVHVRILVGLAQLRASKIGVMSALGNRRFAPSRRRRLIACWNRRFSPSGSRRLSPRRNRWRMRGRRWWYSRLIPE